jgi:hypothetical protein
LLAALQVAIRRKSELSQSGRANLQRAKNWTWDQVADRTAAVYSQCLGVALSKGGTGGVFRMGCRMYGSFASL